MNKVRCVRRKILGVQRIASENSIEYHALVLLPFSPTFFSTWKSLNLTKFRT